MGITCLFFLCHFSENVSIYDLEDELYFLKNLEGSELAYPIVLSPEMISFANHHTGTTSDARKKLNRLIRAVFRKQHLGFQYGNQKTRNAREAFADRRGNCVSFSLMFVALARHAGLRARFQEAIPRDGAASFPVANSKIHMNVVIGRDWEVDFNPNYMKKQFQRRFLSDEEALAHYYNNIGVESLRKGDTEQAMLAARKAVACNASLAAAWNTLAICFKRSEQYHLARVTYQTALAKDPTIIQARANWASMEFDLGYPGEAAAIYAGVTAKNQNPYHLFNRAMTRTQHGDLKGAEKLLLKAVRINPSHSGFYIHLAQMAQGLHRPAEAREYFTQATSRATTIWDREQIKERTPIFKTVHVARMNP